MKYCFLVKPTAFFTHRNPIVHGVECVHTDPFGNVWGIRLLVWLMRSRQLGRYIYIYTKTLEEDQSIDTISRLEMYTPYIGFHIDSWPDVTSYPLWFYLFRSSLRVCTAKVMQTFHPTAWWDSNQQPSNR